ncbi:MAG: trehalose-phosphatase [Chloroflexi bacterium]|nr:trehalose-phosphatase [Chloroflexota bacterium]
MRPLSSLPSALTVIDDIRGRVGDRALALFLDFDGTLSPIVDDPEAALLAPGNHERLARLAVHATVSVISGRDLADVRERVGLEGLYYAGSHGFEVGGPDGFHQQLAEGARFLPSLHRAEDELRARLHRVPGAYVDRKRFALAVHDRRVPAAHLHEVAAVTDEVAGHYPDLRLTAGKRVFELRPDLAWDKGRALLWLLDELALPRAETVAVFIGDDTTDEDAFRALAESGTGFGIVVGGDDRPTAAEYAVRSPREVSQLLERLASWLAAAK